MLEFSNGLINQKKNKKIINFLNQRYLTEESNTSQMAKGSTRSIHADRFIKILKKFYKKNLKNKNILEIGCGSGYILSQLTAEGANVIGIEPSKVIKKFSGLKILNDFSDIEKGQKFDLIISNAVLEHIFDTKEFFRKIQKFSNQNTSIFTCVPDCEFSLQRGDPTILNHEHFSYFTKKNIKIFFSKLGYQSKSINDEFGNIYCFSKKKNILINYKKNLNYSNLLENFNKKFLTLKKNFVKLINYHNDYQIIFYGATAAITNISKYIPTSILKRINILDSDLQKQNKYISGLCKKIYNPNEIKIKNKNNVIIIVFAHYYFKDIKKFLVQKLKINNKNIYNFLELKNDITK